MLQRQGNPPCLGCLVYYAAEVYYTATWDGIRGLLPNIDFAENFSLSAPPPLLPFFHGADSNTPTPASCEATDLQGLPTCEFE